jgi:intein-encoded DNA endonuclease-like protein
MEQNKKIIKKLPPEYIAGYVDGEGCFGLQFRKDVRHERPNTPIYYS